MAYRLNTGNQAKLPEAPPNARGHRARHEPGKMNSLEKRYSEELDLRLLAGEVLWWRFEPLKLRLANGTFYTADFLVMLADRTLEVVEVKGGHWEDDARVKFKVAAEQFPIFRFRAVQWKGKERTEEVR